MEEGRPKKDPTMNSGALMPPPVNIPISLSVVVLLQGGPTEFPPEILLERYYSEVWKDLSNSIQNTSISGVKCVWTPVFILKVRREASQPIYIQSKEAWYGDKLYLEREICPPSS